LSVLLVALALALGSSAPIPWSLALLATLFLLGEHDSLVLAPIYGAGLLLVGELAQCSSELRGVKWLTLRWIASRLAASLALAALGAGAGAVTAAAATIAAARSVALTAAGALATVVAVGTIALLARRRDRALPDRVSTAPDPRARGAP
jgi:hypothetical protein